jgi:hypothetical protein
MSPVRVNAYLRRRQPRPYPTSWTVSRFGRGMSKTEREKFVRILGEIRSGKRAGYTFTGLFKFDIDDRRSMEHVYDKLGPRTMFAIAETNRPASEFDAAQDADIGRVHGIGLWRSFDGTVFADDVRLFFDIDDEEALRLARERNQFNILKVDGRTRMWAFLEAPRYDVEIRGEGAKRTFEPRPEL